MSAVYASKAGLSLRELAIFVASFYVGATVFQYPLGWISDRMDRRVLIMFVAVGGGAGAVIGWIFGDSYPMLLLAAVIVGGTTNPLYSLLIAHTNDFLETGDMAAASGGLVFVNGLGAIVGPVATGWMMEVFGPPGYFGFLTLILVATGGYAAYRTTRRASPSVEDTSVYAPVMPTASPVAVEVVQEYAIETQQEEEEGQQ